MGCSPSGILPTESSHRTSSARNNPLPQTLLTSFQVDPRCPLTERQLYGINKSWKAINRNLVQTAVNMFVRLFETNADIRGWFSELRHYQTLTDLRSSRSLEDHAMKVIYTLDEAIYNLDDIDYVINMLNKVAQSHQQRFAGFDPEFFWKIEEPFLLAVKETLGDRFTVSVENSYRETIRFVLTTLVKGFKESAKQEGPGLIKDSACVNKKLVDGSLFIPHKDGIGKGTEEDGKFRGK